MEWTDKQKQALDSWAYNTVLSEDDRTAIENILSTGKLSKSDIEFLRTIPGFSDVEDKIVPTDKTTQARKIAEQYSSYEDIPQAWRKDMMSKYDLTDSDLQQAFANKQRDENYSDIATEKEERRKMLEDASELSTDKSIGENLVALGLKLAPKEAERYFVRHGVSDKHPGFEGTPFTAWDNKGLVASSILGNVANVLELLPLPFLGSTAAPVALRKIEAHTTGEPDDYTFGDMVSDAGMNALSYLPVKSIFDIAKGQFGSVIGANLEKNEGVKSLVERGISTVDRAGDLDKLQKLEKDKMDFIHSIGSDIRNNNTKVAWELKARQAEELGLDEMARNIRTYGLEHTPEARAAVLADAKNISLNKRLEYDPTKDTFGTAESRSFDPDKFTTEQKQYALDKYIASRTPKWARIVSTGLEYGGRPAARHFTNPSKETTVATIPDAELRNLERQWEAGFVPRGGIELEYYNAWKKRGKK